MNNVLRTIIYNGQVSLTLADTTEIVAEGISRHGLSPAAALVFGKAISAMTYMSSCLKNYAGEISLSIKSEGSCQEVAISGNRALRMRGYIGNPQATGEESSCFGENGSLTIIRDDGYNRPFVGSCAFPAFGGVDEAFEEYYRISEQLPTRIATVVECNEKGECVFAGVVALQPLPYTDEETLDKVFAVDMQALLGEIKAQGIEKCAKGQFTIDEQVWELRRAEYKCNCSRDYLKGVLVSVGEEEMRKIIREDGALRVHCHYCNSDYAFTEADADEMFFKN